MGLFTGFERGSGGTYTFDEASGKVIKTSSEAHDPNSGFNGPVWFPKGGHKYFDKALNRWFYSKAEKKNWMKAHGIIQKADEKTGDTNCPEAGIGKRYYFTNTGRTSKYYKYR